MNIPVLPDEIAQALNDASPADDAATDEAVTAFIAEHVQTSRPETLAGLTSALRKRFEAGESRHQSTVTVLPTAMKEARLGLYPAQTAIEAITPMFLEAAAKPPISGKQGAARNGAVARSEFNGMLAWAVGQALGADLDEVQARIDQKIPPPPDIDDHHTGEWNGEDGGHDGDGDGDGNDTDAPTTWEPVDLGPWLRGEIEQPQPAIGVHRSDGLQLVYPGREHAVLGETESGKTWLALACVAPELTLGHHVVYIHYEEGDPASTIERLQLLGVDPALIAARLRFIAPGRPVQTGWIEALLDPAPTLVIHDGVNEAMSLIGADIMAADGAATFRRRLVTPFLRAGAASIACDHLPKEREGRSRDAYGSVHKGNALDGARIVLENTAPFGRRMRGVSYVFITKDRPGQLRSHGRPTKLPGKTFIGTLVVDDSETIGPDFTMRFFAPKHDDQPAEHDPADELAGTVYDVIAALPDHTATSLRMLYAQIRAAGHQARESTVRDAVDDLIVAGRLIEAPGKRGSCGFQAVSTAAQESPEPTAAATAAAAAAPIRGGSGQQSAGTAAGSSEQQSAAVGEESAENDGDTP
jgi:hypothetical protein